MKLKIITNQPTRGKKNMKKRQKTWKASITGFPQETVSPSSDKLISGHVIELASKRKQPA